MNHFFSPVPLNAAEQGSQSCHRMVLHCRNGLHSDRQCVALGQPASQSHLSELRKHNEWGLSIVVFHTVCYIRRGLRLKIHYSVPQCGLVVGPHIPPRNRGFMPLLADFFIYTLQWLCTQIPILYQFPESVRLFQFMFQIK